MSHIEIDSQMMPNPATPGRTAQGPDPSYSPRKPMDSVPLTVPLSAADASMLQLVGGKAAALGELLHAGFPVPDGFCVTTASYDLVAQNAGLAPHLGPLAATGSQDTARLAQQAGTVREALLAVSLPVHLISALREAVHTLEAASDQGVTAPMASISLAVRSSATAEDLPWASFAGQQETFLNVVEEDGMLDAVRRCFASLWSDRAVAYRANLGIDPRTVRLAVVVQRLVDPEVAGVLFTANPLTGRRREAIIEANPGLGEAVVSGATTPDHFVVATLSGEIIERRPSDKRLVIVPKPDGGTEQVERPASGLEVCLSDAQVQTLASLGARVEAHFGAPQDVEWALDRDGQFWLLQARPITTLYPLPPRAPVTDEDVRVYLCFGVQQGTTRPFTPMGISAIRLMASGLTALMGLAPADPLQGTAFVVEAGSRVFLDVTRALRSAFGRRLLTEMMAEAEVHAAAGLQRLIADPRLALLPARRRRSVFRSVVHLATRTRLPWYLLQALLFPRVAQARVERLVRRARRRGKVPPNAAATQHLRAAERLFFSEAPRLLPRISPVMVAGMQAFSLARRLLAGTATEEELQVVLRGSPANPTVRMNLALWSLAEGIRTDPATARLVRETSPADLAASYLAGRLPSALQRGLAAFLAAWGHHAVAELDVGVPRWSEDAAAVLALLLAYLRQGDGDRAAYAPQKQVERMAREARAMIRTLARRARKRSWLRGLLVGYCLRRAHALAGYREMPRLAAALLLARARTHLWVVGTDMAREGQVERAGDIFFLTLAEAHAVLTNGKDGKPPTVGAQWRTLVRERRDRYDQELVRRHVPLLLLSNGTEPTTLGGDLSQEGSSAWSRLQGTAASPGVVTGRARVIRDPAGAHLEPGEILVAPSTDPGWTPLFLVAGGLVMELGGAMAHGAIVAREYGLPAVVGVTGATERIVTGQHVTVDGSAGTVVLGPAGQAV